MYKYFFALTAAALFAGFLAGAQITSPSSSMITEGGSIELIHADSLVGTTDTKAGLVRHYDGNVSFRHNDIYVTCGTAFHNISGNFLELSGRVGISQRNLYLSSTKMTYDGNTKIASSPVAVTIKQDSQLLKADRGTYSTVSHIANFAGNVYLQDGEIIVTSDSAEQNRITNYSHAFGNVFVERGLKNTVFADNLELFGNADPVKASGNVLITDSKNAAFITADTVDYFDKNLYISAVGNPVLFKIDTLRKDSMICRTTDFAVDTVARGLYDTLSIKSDKMESIETKDSATAYIFHGKAEVFNNTYKAVADSISYIPEHGSVFLHGHPAIWYDSLQLTADTINIVIDTVNQTVSKVLASGNAFMLIKNDTLTPERRNQLFGKNMVIDLTDGKINLVTSTGNAQSLIFINSEKGNDGAATTSADTIKLTFDGKDPADFIATGGILGEAIPEKDIAENCRQYYLPSYIERNDKPIDQKPVLRALLEKQNIAQANSDKIKQTVKIKK